MTVALMPSIVGLEGLHTGLKPTEALIYLYDGRMVELASAASSSWKHHSGIDLP